MKILNSFFVKTCTRHINAPCYSFTFLYATGAGTTGANPAAAMVNRTMAIGAEATGTVANRAMAIGAEATGAEAIGAGATGSGATGSGARNA